MALPAAPRRGLQEWREAGVALLPLGSRFDAVRLPEALVHAAVRTTEPQVIAERLAQRLPGPVIYDGRRNASTVTHHRPEWCPRRQH
ncbi:hypothetical protein [Streptomyces sp. NPDC018059]|uniref:hypothetical protein n=1 Tax=Streptomyces sp. NPDC018059 TaxID=3365041 RepID=UPI00378E109C